MCSSADERAQDILLGLTSFRCSGGGCVRNTSGKALASGTVRFLGVPKMDDDGFHRRGFASRS